MSKTLTTTWQTWCFVIFCLLTGKLKCQGSLVICQRSHVLVSHGEPVQNIPTPTGSSLTPRPGLRVSPPCRPSSCPHLPCAGHHPDPATLRTQEAHPQRHPWGRRAPSPRPPPPGPAARGRPQLGAPPTSCSRAGSGTAAWRALRAVRIRASQSPPRPGARRAGPDASAAPSGFRSPHARTVSPVPPSNPGGGPSHRS